MPPQGRRGAERSAARATADPDAAPAPRSQQKRREPGAAWFALALRPNHDGSPSRLPVVEPDDPLEQEADRLADLVEPEAVRPRTTGALPITHAPASVLDVVASPGRALEERERFALGIDLSPVRVHAGGRASESARELGATAYTVGADIVFGEGYDAGTASGRCLLAHELAHVSQQRAPGSRARGRVLRQPAPAQSQPTSVYDALYDEMWKLQAALSQLVNKRELAAQLNSLMVDLGGPGEKSDAQLADLRRRFEVFRVEREAEYRKVTEWWPELTADYKQEDERLAQSTDATDRRAQALLHDRYRRAEQELKRAGRLADPYDVMPFADCLYERRHLKDAWEGQVQESLEGHEQEEGHWPWPNFERTAKLIEAAVHGGHISEELREQLLSELDLAIHHQIREAVTEMVELGESPIDARAWARKAETASNEAAEELVRKFAGRTGRMLERWHGRLHVAGRLTIVIDVVGSVLDVFAAPPKERPKRAIIQASRFIAGLGAARVGASAGASFGEEFGPEGAVIGGVIGGFLGGLEGSIFAEQAAEFVADEIWPPEDTYAEVVGE